MDLLKATASFRREAIRVITVAVLVETKEVLLSRMARVEDKSLVVN